MRISARELEQLQSRIATADRLLAEARSHCTLVSTEPPEAGVSWNAYAAARWCMEVDRHLRAPEEE